MVFALTHDDLERLYAAPSLEEYRPEAVVAHSLEGKTLPALCDNLREAPEPGEAYFEDIGVFVETLGLAYQFGAVTLFGGKFNPTFGIAWDVAPGIYGADLADDYELTERIGGGGAVTLGGGDFGRHTLTGQVFFLDTSVLSQSWGTESGFNRIKVPKVSQDF